MNKLINMINNIKIILRSLIVLCFLSSCITNSPYEKDLSFIYNQIVENHPGFYNDQDPKFRKNLEREYSKVIQSISRLSTSDKNKKIINNFINSFNDTHLWINWFEENNNRVFKPQVIPKFQINYINSEIVRIEIPTFDLNKKQEKEFKLLLDLMPRLSKKTNYYF